MRYNPRELKLYKSIRRAANTIAREPGKYNFSKGDIPKRKTCGTQTCVLGWVHFHQADFGKLFVNGMRSTWIDPLRIGMAVTEQGFYGRMDSLAINMDYPKHLGRGGYQAWRHDHRICAKVLREYARKYHTPKALPEPKPEVVEQEVEVEEEVLV